MEVNCIIYYMYLSWSTQMVNAHKKCEKNFSLAYHGTLMESGGVFHSIKA